MILVRIIIDSSYIAATVSRVLYLLALAKRGLRGSPAWPQPGDIILLVRCSARASLKNCWVMGDPAQFSWPKKPRQRSGSHQSLSAAFLYERTDAERFL